MFFIHCSLHRWTRIYWTSTWWRSWSTRRTMRISSSVRRGILSDGLTKGTNKLLDWVHICFVMCFCFIMDRKFWLDKKKRIRKVMDFGLWWCGSGFICVGGSVFRMQRYKIREKQSLTEILVFSHEILFYWAIFSDKS